MADLFVELLATLVCWLLVIIAAIGLGMIWFLVGSLI